MFHNALHHSVAQDQVVSQLPRFDAPDAEYDGDRCVRVQYTDGSVKTVTGKGSHKILSKTLWSHTNERPDLNRSMAGTKVVPNTGASLYPEPPSASGASSSRPQQPQQPQQRPDTYTTPLNDALAAALDPQLVDMVGVRSIEFALAVQDHIADKVPGVQVVQQVVFLNADPDDSAACKAAILREQARLLGGRVAEAEVARWQVHKVGSTTTGGPATLPGNWSLDGTRPNHRALQYWPHTHGGEEGVVAILLTRRLLPRQLLCEPPYVHMKFVDLAGGDKGIEIRRVDASSPQIGNAQRQVLYALVAAGGRSSLRDLSAVVPAVETGHRRILTQLVEAQLIAHVDRGEYEITACGRAFV